MNDPQNVLLAGLVLTNVFAGFGAAIPLAISLQKTIGQQHKIRRYFTLLVGIYFLECIAFTSGMCTQVFTFGLAAVWGIIFSLWWRRVADSRKAVRTAFWVSLYGCAPTLSFAFCLLIIWIIGGRGVLDVEGATGFGIPQFVPWPFNTILGFCAGLAVGTFFIKITITTGLVKLLIGRPEQSTG